LPHPTAPRPRPGLPTSPGRKRRALARRPAPLPLPAACGRARAGGMALYNFKKITVVPSAKVRASLPLLGSGPVPQRGASCSRQAAAPVRRALPPPRAAGVASAFAPSPSRRARGLALGWRSRAGRPVPCGRGGSGGSCQRPCPLRGRASFQSRGGVGVPPSSKSLLR